MAEEEGVKEQYPVGTKITFKNGNGIKSGTVWRIDVDSINDKKYIVKFENPLYIIFYYIKVSESDIIGISTGGRKKSHRRKQKSRKHKSRRHVNKRGLSR